MPITSVIEDSWHVSGTQEAEYCSFHYVTTCSLTSQHHAVTLAGVYGGACEREVCVMGHILAGEGSVNAR